MPETSKDPRGRTPINWPADVLALLGEVADAEIAKILSINKATVLLKRKSLGVPALNPGKGQKNLWNLNGNAELLGKMPDAEIGRRLGVSHSAVCQARKFRGIPAFVKPPKEITETSPKRPRGRPAGSSKPDADRRVKIEARTLPRLREKLRELERAEPGWLDRVIDEAPMPPAGD